MNKRNKNVIAFFMSIVLFVGYSFYGDFSVYAQEDNSDTIIIETDDLNTFSDEVTELYDKYEMDVTSDDVDFQSGRLIVESSIPIEDSDAMEIISGYGNLYVIQYEDAKTARDAYEIFLQMDQIQSVQPDRLVQLQNEVITEASSEISIENEEKQEYMSWGSGKIGIDVFNNYIKKNFQSLPEVTVAVLDTGIDMDLDIFKGRILEDGRNFCSSNSKSNPEDDNGHGTMVSCVITDNTYSNVKILPIKVMNRKGEGYDSQIVMGMSYALEYGVDILNMSIGGEGDKSIYESIMNRAEKKGIAVIAAAGNDGVDVNNCTPANINSAITVSSIDENDALCKHSNYGDKIDFAAPGIDIVTAGLDGVLYKAEGTSFATPFVTSVFALVKSVDNEKSGTQIYNMIKENVVDIGADSGAVGWDESTGYGRINLIGFEDVIKKYNYEPGDVNLDRNVNAIDAYLILQYIVGRSEFSEQELKYGDIDNDGTVTVLDVFTILQQEVSG